MNLKLQNYLASYRKIVGNAFQYDVRSLEKFAKALELYNLDKSRKAVDLLTKLLKSCKQDQDYAVVYVFLGICYEEIGYPELAKDAYVTSTNYNDQISTVWSNLGLMHKNSGEFAEAMSCFDKAMACDPNNAYAHYNKGALYYRQADNENALACCYRALQLQHNLYQAAEVVCCIHFIENRQDMYRKYYQMAVSNGSTYERMETILQEYKKINL